MIFYFSGTGNSAWAAQQLAQLTRDEARDIVSLPEPPAIGGVEQIGFVFPVYAWGVPEVMLSFVEKLGPSQAFAFGVCTCGGEAGLTMKAFSRRRPLDSSYSLLMPNNYVVGSQVDSGAVIAEKISRARQALQEMAEEILRRERVYRVHEGSLAGLKSSLANFGFNKFARRTKPFFTTADCNGCGLCAARCPAGTITLQEGRPVWSADCFQCLRCINACPQQAIQYGKGTEGRGRYVIWDYLPQEEKMERNR